jgi:hypothetical protein
MVAKTSWWAYLCFWRNRLWFAGVLDDLFERRHFVVGRSSSPGSNIESPDDDDVQPVSGHSASASVPHSHAWIPFMDNLPPKGPTAGPGSGDYVTPPRCASTFSPGQPAKPSCAANDGDRRNGLSDSINVWGRLRPGNKGTYSTIGEL